MRLLILLLTVIGISALGGSVGLLVGDPMYIAPSLRKIDPLMAHRVLILLAFTYSFAALLTALAAKQRRTWARSAYDAFAISASLLVGFFLYVAPIPRDLFSVATGIAFFTLLGWGLWKGRQVLDAGIQSGQRAV
jgi:hypothetical protein